jgi:hypothetical protein
MRVTAPRSVPLLSVAFAVTSMVGGTGDGVKSIGGVVFRSREVPDCRPDSGKSVRSRLDHR